MGAATLSLLAAAAEDAPVLVLLDDAHWFDAASADALLFAARRLGAERVAVLVTAREGDSEAFDRPAFERLSLTGLDRDAAAALLAAGAGQEVSPDVAERLREASGGNPLALAELSALLPVGQLRGAEPLADPLPVGATAERLYGGQVARLPEDARRALLVAALSSSPAPEPVVEALRLLGVNERSLEPAEDAGLLGVAGGAIAFRHPLVRSAVVHGAPPSERRRAHRALADALAGRRPEERAWHLAAAALGPDEDAAAALAEAGRRARARSGWGSATLALERSARLTPDPAARARRRLEAAESAQVAGRTELSLALIEELLAGEGPEAVRAAAGRLRSRIELHSGDVARALEGLMEGADRLGSEDPAGAIDLLADAVEGAELRGEPRRALDAAARAGAIAPPDGPARFAAEVALGQAHRLAGPWPEARGHLEAALGLLAGSVGLQASIRSLVRGARAARWLGRIPEGRELADRGIELARAEGAFGPLAHALEASSGFAARTGRWPEAYARASEGLELARESRCAWASTRCLEQLAWLDAVQGGEERCRGHADEALEVAGRAGIVSERGRLALGLLALGRGEAAEAGRIYDALDWATLSQADGDRLADPVEAWVRGGRLDEARAAYERSPVPETDPRALRCRGLLAGDDDFEAPFRAALEQHAVEDAFGLARTRLCFGERLRRVGRRIDARGPLRAAHQAFERLGARPWAERAAAELRASGERLGRREARAGEELTPQELQVALHVAEGKTNKEVGAALFLSPKTVDFHLRRVFRKLGLRSRRELMKHLAAAQG